jgi:hypothetical protein
MPLPAPVKPARSVLDGGEHSTILVSQGRHRHPLDLAGYRPAENP